MKSTLCVLLLCTAFAVAQDATTPDNSKHDNGPVTVQGCVTRSNGDYVLIKQDPGVTYELHAAGKIKLHNYLGQRVELTGKTSPSLSTSSDYATRGASPVTLSVSSIKTLDKECPAAPTN